MRKVFSPLFLSSLLVFSFWFFMLTTLVQRERAAANTFLSSEEILGYQPPDDPYYFVIYQDGTPIGFSEGFVGEIDTGQETNYHLTEKTRLLMALGDDYLKTDMFLKTEVDKKFALRSFKVDILTGGTRTKIEGEVKEGELELTIESKEGTTTKTFPIKENATLPVSLAPFLASKKILKDKIYAVDILDPLTLKKTSAKVKYLGLEEIQILQEKFIASKFEIDLKGIVSFIYLDEKGEKIMEELGSGIIAKKETRERVRKIETFLDSLEELPVD